MSAESDKVKNVSSLRATCSSSDTSDTFIWPLYVSRTLAAWGDRTWQFIGGMFLLQLGDSDTSLQIVGVYGLILCLAMLLCGAAIGRLVDSTARNRMVTCSIFIQNMSIVSACFIMALHFIEFYEHDPFINTCITSGVIFLCTVSYLASMAARISVEKDWVVCLCEDDTTKLSKVNTNIRTIDLICNLTAPLLAGQLLYFCEYYIAGIILIFWVLTSTTIELLLLNHLFKKIDRLQSKMIVSREEQEGLLSRMLSIFSGWSTYFNHHIREAGLGLSMLYMTVLGFDTITWGYCKQQGVTDSVLGALTGVSALVGVFGARMYPFLNKKLTLTNTGLLGLFLQTSCITLCVVAIWCPGSPFMWSPYNNNSLNINQDANITHLQASGHDQIVLNVTLQAQNFDQIEFDENVQNNTNIGDNTEESYQGSYISVTLLLVGIISSRFGLYIADLSVHQIFQEELEEQQRGTVSGVQTGLCSLMDLLKFGLVIALPHPNEFGFLIILSFLFIAGGGLMLLKYKLKMRPGDVSETGGLLEDNK